MNTTISRAPQGLTLPERPDLYWGNQFAQGGGIAWQPRQGLTLSTAKARKELRDLLDNPRAGDNVLAALSAMDGWGIFSGHHLALMTGNRANLRESSKALETLIRLGILDLGAPHMLRPRRSPTRYFRRRLDGPLGRLASVMTAEENRLVRGAATTWNQPSGHDRHDLLALELAMRVAEHHRDIVGVVGERHVKAVALQSATWKAEGQWHHRGDALLVRDDEVRFVVEITAARTEHLQQKIERWCRWIEGNPVERNGVVILWVCTPNPITGRGMTASQMRKMLTTAFRSHPTRSKGKPIGRIAVVDWANWFPAPGETSSEFMQMDAWMMGAMRHWEKLPLASMSWPVDGVDSVAIPAMGHIPVWLK